MSEREWRQEGEGRHPTLAGNIFDPNVQGGSGAGSNVGTGSGLTGSTGESVTPGVAGSSAEGTAESGASSTGGGYMQSALNMVGLGRQPDIVKNYETAPPTGGATGERSGMTGGNGLTGSSGYGAETGDLSGGRSGLSGGQSGLSGESGDGTTGVTGREAYGRPEGTNTSGLGGDYSNVEDRNSSSGLTGASNSGAGASGADTYVGSQNRGASNSGFDDGSAVDRAGQGFSSGSVGDNSAVGNHTQNDTRSAVGGATGPEDSEIADRAAGQQLQNERTEADDPAASGPGQNQEVGSGGGASLAEKANNPEENKKAATRENHNAIPTAGGVQLGEKHWGESKVVPDNPKPQGEAGVQSSNNDKTTSANTAQNIGGASGPPGSSHTEEKEGAMDKIKHKLHMG